MSCTNKRLGLHAGDIIWIRAMQIASGTLLLIELDQNTSRDGFARERCAFFSASIAPEDTIGTAKDRRLFDKFKNISVVRILRSHPFNHINSANKTKGKRSSIG